MIVERVELEVLDGRETAFEAALCEVRQRVFMSAGFRGFSVAQSIRTPTTYLVQVRWETVEELARYTESRFEQAWAPVDPFLARRPRVDHFAERPSLASQGPGVITDLAWLRE